MSDKGIPSDYGVAGTQPVTFDLILTISGQTQIADINILTLNSAFELGGGTHKIIMPQINLRFSSSYSVSLKAQLRRNQQIKVDISAK